MVRVHVHPVPRAILLDGDEDLDTDPLEGGGAGQRKVDETDRVVRPVGHYWSLCRFGPADECLARKHALQLFAS